MMWDLAWAVVPFAISMTASPGPNNVMITASATNFGFKRTVPPLLGIAAGLGVMMLLVGVGLGRLLETFPIVHVALKYVGTAYLLYLAWRIATSSPPGEGETKAKPLSFWEAALFQWVNPKTWVAALSAMTMYISADGNAVMQALVIAAVFALISLPSVGAWALFGQAAARLLRTPQNLRVFNLIMATLLALSVITLFI